MRESLPEGSQGLETRVGKRKNGGRKHVPKSIRGVTRLMDYARQQENGVVTLFTRINKRSHMSINKGLRTSAFQVRAVRATLCLVLEVVGPDLLDLRDGAA